MFSVSLIIHRGKQHYKQTWNTGGGTAEVITEIFLFCKTHCLNLTMTSLQGAPLLDEEASPVSHLQSRRGSGRKADTACPFRGPHTSSAGMVTPKSFFLSPVLPPTPPARVLWRAWRRAALPRLRPPLTGPRQGKAAPPGSGATRAAGAPAQAARDAHSRLPSFHRQARRRSRRLRTPMPRGTACRPH